MPEQSTKTDRWNDIFYVDRLWSWTNFIAERIGMGDHEPTIDAAKKLNVRQLW